MPNVGEDVYIITKNGGTFQLEVTKAKIERITADSICCIQRHNVYVASGWEFPKEAWNKEIFYDEKDAEAALDRIVNWRRYDKEN